MTIKATLSIFAVLVLAVVASAQGGGRGGQRMMRMGGNDNPAFLLMRPDVQRDLGLTDDQKSKLQAAQEAMREQMMQRMQGGGQQDREAMMAEMRKMQEEQAKTVNAILTPEQQKRLQEISIQLGGNRAVARKEVADALGLSEAQRKSISDLTAKQGEANRELMERMRNGELDRDQFRTSQQNNQRILNEEIGKILTEAQRAKLKEMAGKEFKPDPDNN
jgi:hypothetical protein